MMIEIPPVRWLHPIKDVMWSLWVLLEVYGYRRWCSSVTSALQSLSLTFFNSLNSQVIVYCYTGLIEPSPATLFHRALLRISLSPACGFRSLILTTNFGGIGLWRLLAVQHPAEKAFFRFGASFILWSVHFWTRLAASSYAQRSMPHCSRSIQSTAIPHLLESLRKKQISHRVLVSATSPVAFLPNWIGIVWGWAMPFLSVVSSLFSAIFLLPFPAGFPIWPLIFSSVPWLLFCFPLRFSPYCQGSESSSSLTGVAAAEPFLV